MTKTGFIYRCELCGVDYHRPPDATCRLDIYSTFNGLRAFNSVWHKCADGRHGSAKLIGVDDREPPEVTK